MAPAFLFEQNREIGLRLIVLRINLEDFLIIFFGLYCIAQILVDVRQVEERRCILLFVDGNFQVMNCFVGVLLLVVEEHTDVEIGLKVLRVCLEGLLVILQALLVATLAFKGQLLDALRHGVEPVDVLRVELQDLQVNLFL